MKKLFLLLFVLVLFSCGYSNWVRENGNYWGDKKEGLKRVQTSNPDIKLELLFETKEFKMYRFVDMAHTRYVALKKDGIKVIDEESASSGKTTVYDDGSIETK